MVIPEDKDTVSNSQSDDNDEFNDLSEGEGETDITYSNDERKERKVKMKVVKDEGTDVYYYIEVPVDEEGYIVQKEDTKVYFPDGQYLIASPKVWLEFAFPGIQNIAWNDNAFDSLIIPNDQKQMVKSLVESHERNAENNIQDIIHG